MKARALALVALGAALAVLGGPVACADEKLPRGGLAASPFGAALSARLAADGFDRAAVEKLLGDTRAKILKPTIAYAIVYRESKADYSRFLSRERLDRARKFLKEESPLLAAAEKKYGVSPEVASSILMIESNFGDFHKTYPTFNVFVTLIWSSRPENFDAVSGVITRRIPDVAGETIRKRARKKEKWAYEELGYLLKIAEREKLDLLDLEGSWAGAFGLPQFIPSSYWHYAVDGDGDGKVRLFDEADAVFSVGNYLSAHGWKPGLDETAKKAVLRRYNNSSLYVDTVLAAAKLLSGETKGK